MARHNELGKKGEELAILFLESKGITILEKNWRYIRAEIDIMFVQDETLVLTEVKTRSSSAYGNPEEFISNKKLALYLDAAEEYLKQKKMNYEIRFDIISIVFYFNKPIIKHIEDAF
jgi:putative endonuclease